MEMISQWFFLIITFQYGCGAKILGVFHYPSQSHHILGESLLKGLAAQGHEVTMLSPFHTKLRPKNYQEIVLPELLHYKNENMSDKFMHMHNQTVFKMYTSFFFHFMALEDLFFNSKLVQQLINNNRSFDLAVVTWFGYESILGFSHHVANSTIVFSTVGTTYTTKQITKVPTPYSYVPGILPPFPNEMTFKQRLLNTLCNSLIQFVQALVSYQQQLVINQYFPHAPSINDLIEHVSLVFINTHYSIESPRPYLPHMIQVGGLHLENEKTLESGLKQVMDTANDGVIYFSLGSNLRSSDISHEILDGIIKSFSKLSQTVLWKIEKINITSIPKNIQIRDWFPQKEILAHKNTKLFITHGGLLSTIESLYYGVPMIGIPMFSDQNANVLDSVTKGYMYHLPFSNLSQHSISDAISEIMNNKKYKENAILRSRVFRDQLNKPLDRAIYWVEYVIRHKGAHHLKSGVLKLWWYQYELLDVYAAIILFVFGSIYAMYILLKLLNKFCKQNIKQKQKSKMS